MTNTTTTTSTTIFKILLLTIALASVSYSQETCCADCIKDLTTEKKVGTGDKEITLKAVTTITAPEKDATTGKFSADKLCGKVFTAHGACVDQASLIERTTSWKKHSIRTYQHILKSLRKYVGLKKNLSKMIEKMSSDETKTKLKLGKNPPNSPKGKRPPRKKKDGTKITARRLLAEGTAIDDAGITALLKPIKDIITRKTKGDKNDATASKKETFTACFKEMGKFRLNGLCMRASGAASANFIAESGGYKLKSETCVPLIKSCGAIFATLIEARALRVATEKFRYAMAGDDAKPDADIKVDPPLESVVEDWATCGNDVNACSEGDLLTPLCSDFAIQEEPIKPEHMDKGFASAKKDGGLPDEDTVPAAKTRILETDNTIYGYVVVDATGADLSSADFASGDVMTEFSEEETKTSSGKIISMIVTLGLLNFLF